MANTVKLKRSAVASAVPTTAQLELGELAINTNDGKLFLKRNNGTESIVEVGAGGGVGGTITADLGSASAPSYTFTGDTNTGIFSPGADTIAFSEGGVEAMRIDSDGHVGIGTTNPRERLNIVGSESLGFIAETASTQTSIILHPTALFINSSTAAGNGLGLRYQIADSIGTERTAGGMGVVATAKTDSSLTADMYFYTGLSSERMRITSAGNVGIGTTTPGAKLQINAQDGFRFDVETSAASTMRFGSASTGEGTGALAFVRTAGAITLSNGATGSALTERMRIDSTGNVGIGTTSPGYKLSVSGTAEITAAKEGVFTITDGATVNLDPNNGSIQTWTLGANRTPGQANWASGQSITLMIDDGTAFAITWTTLGVVWETNAGSAPTLATTGLTAIVLWKVGTTIYGARVGDA